MSHSILLQWVPTRIWTSIGVKVWSRRLLAFAAIYAVGDWTAQSVADAADTPPQNVTLADFLDLTQRHTGYRIELQGAASEKSIASPVSHVDVDEAIAQLLKELGVASHVAVVDSENHVIQIIVMGEMSDVALLSSPALLDKEAFSPYDFSPEELEEIKSDYLSSRENEPESVEISPPSEVGGGLSRSELERIKTDHLWQQEVRGDIGTVFPPSEEGGDLNAQDLASIKNTYLQTRPDPGSHVSPGSELGHGVSTYELAEMKMAYLTSAPDPSQLISPGSELGPGLTVDELDALKAEYLLDQRRPALDGRIAPKKTE